MMKKHAVCILCHEKPEQVNAIVGLFPPEYFDFFIHVDKKSDIQGELTRASNVRFVAEDARVDVRWGRFSQVRSSMAVFDCVDAERYGYVHLISGVDFPVRPPMEIYEACEKSGLEYIECHALPEETRWAWGGMDRVLVRYPGWMIRRPRAKAVRALRLAYRECVLRTGVLRRRRLPVEKFYGGSSWFSVTGECLQWMKDYLRAHPEYVRFFSTGLCVDEIIYPTLVRLSPFADRVANRAMRFLVWEGSRTGGPRTLTAEDIPRMRESDAFFARKVDSLALCGQMRRELIEATM